MKQVLLLGSGFVAKPAVDYLLRRDDVHITVISLFQNELESISKGFPKEKITTVQLDILNNIDKLSEYIPKSKVVISLIPATFHVKIAQLCLQHKVNLVTASYTSKEMKQLDQQAKDEGLIFLNELGLDPGIDHMSAMKIIDQVKQHNGKVISFVSWCGALPEKSIADSNPFGYKFSWSPRGVLSSSGLDATFLWDKAVEKVPAHIKFGVMQSVQIKSTSGDVFEFEGVANRDSFPYIDEYQLVKGDVQTMYRGTLRWGGFSVLIRALLAIGLFNQADDSARINDSKSWRSYLIKVLGCNDNDQDLLYCLESTIRESFTKYQKEADELNFKFPIIKRDIEADVKTSMDGIKWLGLLEAEGGAVFTPKPTAIDTLCALLEKKLAYNPGERDLVVLQHELTTEYPAENNRKEREYSQLICYGNPDGSTATSLTVGLPVGIAVELILDDEVKARGVVGPVTPEFYNPILDRLKSQGIEMVEYKEKI